MKRKRFFEGADCLGLPSSDDLRQRAMFRAGVQSCAAFGVIRRVSKVPRGYEMSSLPPSIGPEKQASFTNNSRSGLGMELCGRDDVKVVLSQNHRATAILCLPLRPKNRVFS